MTNKVAVFMEQEDKTFKGINVYENGFLDGVGRLLIENYRDRASVENLINMQTPIITLGNNLDNVVELDEVITETVEDYDKFLLETHIDPRACLKAIESYKGEDVTVVLDNNKKEELFAENSDDMKNGHYFEYVSNDDNLPVKRVADVSYNMPLLYVYCKSDVWLIFKYDEETQSYTKVDILSMLLMDKQLI
ncbi:hypothetical protein ACR56S_11775 [Staphylococcus hominis]|uniref:hypothetical protein n=1 Tax=Staphylococcus hominis TaxID=1290 RepID=UPI003DA0EC08